MNRHGFEQCEYVPHIPRMKAYFLARNLGSRKVNQLAVSTDESSTLEGAGIEVKGVRGCEVDADASSLIILNDNPLVTAVAFKTANTVKAKKVLLKANHKLTRGVVLIV